MALPSPLGDNWGGEEWGGEEGGGEEGGGEGVKDIQCNELITCIINYYGEIYYNVHVYINLRYKPHPLQTTPTDTPSFETALDSSTLPC